MTYQAGLLPHERPEFVPEHVHVLTLGAFEWRQQPRKVRLDLGFSNLRQLLAGNVCRQAVPSNAAEHGRTPDAIAAKSIRPMHTTGILSGNEQALHIAPAGSIDAHATHQVMCRR